MEPKDTVQTEFFKVFTNTKCEFFPCHKGVKEEEFNCMFCYCPLQYLECKGNYTVFTGSDGITRKDCSQCIYPHQGKKGWHFIQAGLKNPVPWSGK